MKEVKYAVVHPTNNYFGGLSTRVVLATTDDRQYSADQRCGGAWGTQ
jgi:hypothetical protein